jgi:formylglycine-generating enzyme required for sulfatase activity
LLYWSDQLTFGFTRKALDERLKAGRCTLLIDSLDELPNVADREQIGQLVGEAAQVYKRCGFVVTSRPYAAASLPAGFDAVTIDVFQREEIVLFLEQWVRLLFVDALDSKRQQEQDALCAAILDDADSDLRLLAANPVMLTCMAVIHYNNKKLPAGRADLFEAVVQWLLHARPRGGDREDARFVEDRHKEIALHMFRAQGGRTFRIGRLEAAKAIEKYFKSVPEALEFIAREEADTGLLIARGDGDLAFWLPSFQEYLAAKNIAGRTDDLLAGWWSIIEPVLDNDDWREVAALIPACLNRLGTERVDLFFHRMSGGVLTLSAEAQIRRAALGGRILRDLSSSGYSCEGVAGWGTLLQTVGQLFVSPMPQLGLQERFEAAAAFGIAGDNRLTAGKPTWIAVPAGSFLMGAQSTQPKEAGFDSYAVAHEGPVCEVRLEAFEIAKYPVTVLEYEAFIRDRGYVTEEFWSRHGWRWRLATDVRSPSDWQEQRHLPNCPVTAVSWFEADAYCNWLQAKLYPRGDVLVRLSSEAQWEYAVRLRIPVGRRFEWGNQLSEGAAAEANWAGCDLRRATPVGMFPPSTTSLGIVDAIGNVEEWCEDRWKADHEGRPQDGRPRQADGEARYVVKGGSTIRFLRLCRPTYRSRCLGDKRYRTIGFRPIRAVRPPNES